MRQFLYNKIFQHTDPYEQLKETEKLVAQGELQRFCVGDETICFIDLKDDPKREAQELVEPLHKLQGAMGILRSTGHTREAADYRDAIARLHQMFPDLKQFERRYQEQYSRAMREKLDR